MVTKEEYKWACEVVKGYEKQTREKLKDVKSLYLSDCELSVRTFNILIFQGAEIMGLEPPQNRNRWQLKLIEFDKISISEIKKARGFGKASLRELKELFDKYGLSFSK